MPELLEDQIHQTAPALNAVNEGQSSLVAMVADACTPRESITQERAPEEFNK